MIPPIWIVIGVVFIALVSFFFGFGEGRDYEYKNSERVLDEIYQASKDLERKQAEFAKELDKISTQLKSIVKEYQDIQNEEF